MATPTRGPSVAVLAIQSTHALQIAEQLRADVQRILRETPAAAFLSPEGDHYELSQAIGHLHAAERALLSARQTLRAVSDRQPRPLTPAEQAAEAEVLA